MASGDLYQLTMVGTGNGQNTLNIFHYLQTVGTNNALSMMNTFINDVLPTIRPLFHPSWSVIGFTVKDMADPTDFASDATVFTGTGSAQGDAMPTQDALSFTYLSNRLDARSGGKRLGIYPEGYQSGGTRQGVAVTRIVAAEVGLEATISSGLGDSWRPVIYGKRTGSANYFANPLSGVRFFGFTTQNNRKFYTSPGI